MASQKARAKAVEGPDPRGRAREAEAEHALDSLPHLFRSLVGERDGENLRGVRTEVIQQVHDLVSDDACLP
jgi:hypothetical protein